MAKFVLKIILYIFLFIIVGAVIGTGIWAGMDLYKESTLFSENYGNIVIPAEVSVFETQINTLVLFENESGDFFVQDSFAAVKSFNATDNDYVLKVNEQVTKLTADNAGKITGTVRLYYYDTDGESIGYVDLHFAFEFFTASTRMTITVVPDYDDTLAYLNQYTLNNGLQIIILEE